MSKFANVAMVEKSMVMAMMFRIIGSVMKRSRCRAVAPSMAAASYSSPGMDVSPARNMIMKKGVPIQTLTRMTENRARPAGSATGCGGPRAARGSR